MRTADLVGCCNYNMLMNNITAGFLSTIGVHACAIASYSCINMFSIMEALLLHMVSLV